MNLYLVFAAGLTLLWRASVAVEPIPASSLYLLPRNAKQDFSPTFLQQNPAQEKTLFNGETKIRNFPKKAIASTVHNLPKYKKKPESPDKRKPKVLIWVKNPTQKQAEIDERPAMKRFAYLERLRNAFENKKRADMMPFEYLEALRSQIESPQSEEEADRYISLFDYLLTYFNTAHPTSPPPPSTALPPLQNEDENPVYPDEGVVDYDQNYYDADEKWVKEQIEAAASSSDDSEEESPTVESVDSGSSPLEIAQAHADTPVNEENDHEPDGDKPDDEHKPDDDHSTNDDSVPSSSPDTEDEAKAQLSSSKSSQSETEVKHVVHESDIAAKATLQADNNAESDSLPKFENDYFKMGSAYPSNSKEIEESVALLKRVINGSPIFSKLKQARDESDRLEFPGYSLYGAGVLGGMLDPMLLLSLVYKGISNLGSQLVEAAVTSPDFVAKLDEYKKRKQSGPQTDLKAVVTNDANEAENDFKDFVEEDVHDVIEQLEEGRENLREDSELNLKFEDSVETAMKEMGREISNKKTHVKKVVGINHQKATPTKSKDKTVKPPLLNHDEIDYSHFVLHTPHKMSTPGPAKEEGNRTHHTDESSTSYFESPILSSTLASKKHTAPSPVNADADADVETETTSGLILATQSVSKVSSGNDHPSTVEPNSDPKKESQKQPNQISLSTETEDLGSPPTHEIQYGEPEVSEELEESPISPQLPSFWFKH